MATPEQHCEVRSSQVAAPAPPAAGMVRVGRSPARTGWPTVLLATVVAAPLFASPTAGLIGGPLGFPIALAGWAVLLGGGLPAILIGYYRPVAFDPAAGLARLGRATVPLASVTAARREVSAGSSSAYLRYRFAATDGAWGRVLVTGRPIGGLRPEDVPVLEQFVAATAIPASPAAGDLPPYQRAVADAIGVDSVTPFQTYSAKRPVGKAEILAELRGEVLQQAGAEADLPPRDTLWMQWTRDDQEAESVVLRSGADTVRRVSGWVTAGAVAAGLAVVAGAAIRESTSGSLDTQAEDTVVALLLPAIGLGLVSYLGYAIAGAVSTRRAQRAVLAWLPGRDDQQVARGLPPRLLPPFLGPPPGHRLLLAGGFASSVVGGLGLLGAAIAGFTPEPPPGGVGVGIAVLGLPGAALGWVAVVLFRRARRATRTQRQLAARLGGRRLADRLTGTTTT